MEKTLINPIEDQRKQALEHYEEAARIACHWSSFVRDAILAYNPTPPSPVEGEKEELRKRFDKHVNFIKSATTISLADKRIEDAFDFFYSEIEARAKKANAEFMAELRVKEEAIVLYQKAASRIKALEQSEDELCRKIEKEQAETIKIYNHYEAKVKALEERLEAAEKVISTQKAFYNSIHGRDIVADLSKEMLMNEALEAYNKTLL